MKVLIQALGRSKRMAVLLAIFALTASPANAEVFDDITVISSDFTNGTSIHGYKLFRFDIQNSSATDSHLVELQLPERAYNSNGNFIRNLTRQATISPGASISLDVYQPAVPIYGMNTVAVYVDNRKVGSMNAWGNLRNHAGQGIYGSSSSIPFGPFTILVGASRSFNQVVVQAEIQKATTLGTGTSSSSPGSPGDLVFWNFSQTGVSQWPNSWLAYSSFDCVMVESDEFQSAPPLIREAIRKYVSAGGLLVLTDADPSSPPFPMGIQIDKTENRSVFRLGFGEVQLFRMRNNEWFQGEDYKILVSGLNMSLMPWKNQPDENSANASFQVISDFNVPARGFVSVMLIFFLMIGPVNFFILSRMNRRIWVVWTTPLIALLTCAVLFIYSLISEGVTAKQVSRSVVYLDHSNNTYSYLGALAFYCPLTPSSGLKFETTTEVSPWISMNRWGSGSVRSLNWSDGQRLTRGWVSARSPAHFSIRKSGTKRERIDISTDVNGDPIALNGLGSEIRELYYRKSDGTLMHLKNLPAGKSAALSNVSNAPSALGPVATSNQIRQMYSSGEWRNMDQKIDHSQIQPGSYMALLKEDPFLEKPLEGRVEIDSGTLVIGLMDPNEGNLP